MILSWIGLRPSGLKRSRGFFSFFSRFINKPFFSFSKAVWSLTLFGVSLVSFINSANKSYWSEKLGYLSVNLAAPIVSIPQRINDFMSQSQLALKHNRSLKKQIDSMTEEMEVLKKVASRTEQLERENHHLRQILNVTSDFSHSIKRVKVLGAPFDRLKSSIIIAGGEDVGLQKNQPVTTADGVLGRISEVGASASRILLITDSNSRIPVHIESSGEQAILAGQNSDEMVIVHIENARSENGVEIKSHEAKVGDKLFTSGFGGVFPPNLPVGVISQILGDTILVAPLANPRFSPYVNVIESPMNSDES
jgi:rod shape-determining protein MreC